MIGFLCYAGNFLKTQMTVSGPVIAAFAFSAAALFLFTVAGAISAGDFMASHEKVADYYEKFWQFERTAHVLVFSFIGMLLAKLGFDTHQAAATFAFLLGGVGVALANAHLLGGVKMTPWIWGIAGLIALLCVALFVAVQAAPKA